MKWNPNRSLSLAMLNGKLIKGRIVTCITAQSLLPFVAIAAFGIASSEYASIAEERLTIVYFRLLGTASPAAHLATKGEAATFLYIVTLQLFPWMYGLSTSGGRTQRDVRWVTTAQKYGDQAFAIRLLFF
jgi:hypothetical protein